MSNLAVTAQYYQQSDTVECWAQVIDDNGDPLAPVDIKSMTGQLRKGETVLLETDTLDKFFANEDFSFQWMFLNPSNNRMLEVKVTAIDRDENNTWIKTVPVQLAQISAVENDFADNANNIIE